MCECLEYDDGSMHLCEACAPLYQEMERQSTEAYDAGVEQGRREAFEEAASIAMEGWTEEPVSAFLVQARRIAAKIRARIPEHPLDKKVAKP